ncbi:hypothetical protein EB821_02630 [Candidatus Marinimicrobia bacterium PRS2]|nr:hypothetical protein EB821_02630 [Candidatus Marinimicrobia bacterium PRS2]
MPFQQEPISIVCKMNKSIEYPKGFILITSIVLMFVCSSIIFAYFMRVSHEYQRVEINIAKAKAKYNALSGFALEAYGDMFFRDFISDLENGEPADSIKYYSGSKELDMEEYPWFNCSPDMRPSECMGDFDSISVRIRKTEGQLVRHGYALGTAYYENIIKKTLTLTDSVDITTEPLPKLNTFMYLTGDELAGGAPQVMYDGVRGTVKFRSEDEFDGGENGDFQTNGTLVTNGPPNCPQFWSTVTLTRTSEGEINEPDLNGCNFSYVFKGEPPTDTSGTVCLPPPSFDQKKKFADFTFDATELLVSDGLSYPGGFQRDTLIMTELEFLVGGGFRASRYKYLMPPHLKRSLTPSTTPSSPNGSHLETERWNGTSNAGCFQGMEIDNCTQYKTLLNRYHAKTVSSGNEEYIDPDVREAHGLHHFDTHLFRYDPGLFGGSEFEPDGISVKSTELTTDSYFPSEPVAIYIKGGPVLVHGTFKGRYTVITDEYMTYRRHAYPVNNDATPIDTIYCNIWLVGDLVNADATYEGSQAVLSSEFLPDDKCKGGSGNGIGLVSGANVIIANTRVNGARSGSANGGGLHINIHAHMIAFNESFTIQYWQNSTSYWNDWNENNPYGGNPTTLADGNGMRYGSYTNGSYLEDDDDRGNLYLLGGFVQLYRGYMFRNYQGPYNITPGIGMDKHYTWDDNMRCNTLPLYPEKIECDNDSGSPQYDFKIAQFRIF